MNVKCSICGKVVKERHACSGEYTHFPSAHEGWSKGQPCHGFYVQAILFKEDNNE